MFFRKPNHLRALEKEKRILSMWAAEIMTISIMKTNVRTTNQYKVVMPVMSLGTNPAGGMKVYKEFTFMLIVEATRRRTDYVLWSCEGTPIPFHPHFEILSENLQRVAKWSSARNQKTKQFLNASEFLFHVYKSLQYHPEYLGSHEGACVNKEALYKYEGSKGNKSLYPYGPNKAGEVLLPRKFKVVSRSEALALVNKDLPEWEGINSQFRGDLVEVISKLYFTKAAELHIKGHIEYGKTTSSNVVEQGGLLVGLSFQHKETIWGIVLDAIPATNTRGSAVSVEFGGDAWLKMLTTYDTMKERSERYDLRILGWYHTHPNNLDVFMSNTDMGTQVKFFSEDWQFAMVVNPHRQIWRVFQGAEAKECLGVFLQNEPALP